MGSDHGGYDLKEYVKSLLSEKGIPVEDVGSFSSDSCDYPDYGRLVADAVASGKASNGILICTSGIGMSIVANRYAKVRAALCYNRIAAELSRAHNDANVLVMGSRFVEQSEAREIVSAFLETEFEGGRHCRRVGKIEAILNKEKTSS